MWRRWEERTQGSIGGGRRKGPAQESGIGVEDSSHSKIHVGCTKSRDDDFAGHWLYALKNKCVFRDVLKVVRCFRSRIVRGS